MDLEENQTPKEGTSSGNEENTYITFSEDIVQLVNSGGQVWSSNNTSILTVSI